MLGSLLDYFVGAGSSTVVRDSWTSPLSTISRTERLLVLRGTRAMQVGTGLLLVFVLYVVRRNSPRHVNKRTLGALIPEPSSHSRSRTRTTFGRGSCAWEVSRGFGFTRAGESQAIDEVVEASTELAKHRIGAIIAFEQMPTWTSSSA